MSETEATFSGAKRGTVQVIYDYKIVTGQGNSAKKALDDLESEVFDQVVNLPLTPVGGSDRLARRRADTWVAYQPFIVYEDEDVEE